jgi:hypothetical protein
MGGVGLLVFGCDSLSSADPLSSAFDTFADFAADDGLMRG